MSNKVINPDLYKPNSYKSKKENDKKKDVKAVVKHAETRDEPVSKKLAGTFLSEDMDSVKTYILFDVLIPSIKDAISAIIHNGSDMLIYGVTGQTRGRGGNSRGTYVSYNNMSKRDRPENRGRRSVHDFREITYDSREEAAMVLEELYEIIQQYPDEGASVADLYTLSNITPNFTDNKYGWNDISGVRVKQIRGGRFIIDLPRPVLLED